MKRLFTAIKAKKTKSEEKKRLFALIDSMPEPQRLDAIIKIRMEIGRELQEAMTKRYFAR